MDGAGDDQQQQQHDIVSLLRSPRPTRICAPMVRYSKLAFRQLVREYGCELAYTPMIVADSFLRSPQCRDAEFTTSSRDRPLVVQLAANRPRDFADAARMVAPHADGVGLNCGCPQRWAMAEGYGAAMLRRPDAIKDYVRQARAAVDRPGFTVSVKIRLLDDDRRTVDVCRALEHAGVSYVSVHGRTARERHQPVHYDSIRLVKSALRIPVVANGDVTSMEELGRVCDVTGADGVMVARGLLANPAMFDGRFAHTPAQCVRDWVRIALRSGTSFTCFHNHLIYMMDRLASRPDKRLFNNLQSTAAVLEHLNRFALS